MKYFYDTEFLEDGYTIDLISIGIVCEDGREFYAVSFDAMPMSNSPLSRRIAAHPWLTENVMDKVLEDPRQHGKDAGIWSRGAMARGVYQFLDGPEELLSSSSIELWADYPAYDHVVLCQLWGSMRDLPSGIPYRTNCLKQHAVTSRAMVIQAGCPKNDPVLDVFQAPPQDPAVEHHALWDARHNFAWAKQMEIV